MTAIVINNIRVLAANQFLNAFQSKKNIPWTTGSTVSIGDVVYNGSYKYIAVSSGTTGATAPSHASGTVSDGNVDWLYVETYDNTANFNNNLYVAIGKHSPWDNPTPGDETPVAPVDDEQSQLSNLTNIISAKRIEANMVKLGITRHDWDSTGTTIYSEYDPTVEGFNYPTPFYVIADNNVYKCLSNNGGVVSQTKPTGTSADAFVTPGDGYVWKYMCSVDPSDAIQFLTSDYIPVAIKRSDDGSPQWNAQQNAKPMSISNIKVTNGGSGYTNATVTIDAPTSGTTATATPVIQGGVITSIQLTIIGEGYDSVPNVTISGDGSGGTATATLAPKDGHGSNVIKELNAQFAIVNARFDDDEGGYFPVSGESDFRQISIIVDPRDVHGNNAEAPRYIGPNHDDWDGSETSGKSELSKGSGTTLYIDHIEPVVRTAGQIEDLKIVIKF